MNAIVKNEQEQIPDFMRNDSRAGMGTEALSSNAFSPPRIKLAQATSPELETIEGLRAGMYFNTLSRFVYGDSVEFIPCWLTESYYLWSPRTGGDSKLLARADDGVHWTPPNQSFTVNLTKKDTAVWVTSKTVMESGLAEWGSSDPTDSNSPPAATYSINVVALIKGEEHQGPVALSFMRSGLKAAKNFAGALRMSRIPSFGRVFKLTSSKVEGPSGPYYSPMFTANGLITEQEVYESAKAIYEIAKERGVTLSGEDDDAPATHKSSDTKVNEELEGSKQM